MGTLFHYIGAWAALVLERWIGMGSKDPPMTGIVVPSSAFHTRPILLSWPNQESPCLGLPTWMAGAPESRPI